MGCEPQARFLHMETASPMKYTLSAIAAAALLSGCAGTNVVRTQVASAELHPKAIYIRPFAVGEFRGNHHGEGAKAIYQAQAPAMFAEILKEELEKIAPTHILDDDEIPTTGWLVEGELQIVDAGSPYARALPVAGKLGAGRSGILTHVQVSEVGGSRHSDGKGGVRNTLYEFDVAGGSRLTGRHGQVMAPGLGYAVPFDYRNTAERIYQTLTPDFARYGARTSVSFR
jgi:hypothetical protein